MNIRLASPILISVAILAIQAPAIFAQTPSKVDLNNEGVMATNAGKFDLAIEKLKLALKIDPSYGLAHENLTVALNNYALKSRANQRKRSNCFTWVLTLIQTTKR